MIYQIILINGKIIEFEADEHEYEDGTYTFILGGEAVAEFQRSNIAGYCRVEIDEDEI